MDWTVLLNTFLGALLGAMLPVMAFAFWLGGLAQQVKALCERCGKREADHCHHYNKLSVHDVAIGQHETRILSLEQWRSHEET